MLYFSSLSQLLSIYPYPLFNQLLNLNAFAIILQYEFFYLSIICSLPTTLIARYQLYLALSLTKTSFAFILTKLLAYSTTLIMLSHLFRYNLTSFPLFLPPLTTYLLQPAKRAIFATNLLNPSNPKSTNEVCFVETVIAMLTRHSLHYIPLFATTISILSRIPISTLTNLSHPYMLSFSLSLSRLEKHDLIYFYLRSSLTVSLLYSSSIFRYTDIVRYPDHPNNLYSFVASQPRSLIASLPLHLFLVKQPLCYTDSYLYKATAKRTFPNISLLFATILSLLTLICIFNRDYSNPSFHPVLYYPLFLFKSVSYFLFLLNFRSSYLRRT